MEISEKELIGKTVMSEKGFPVGVIKKYLMDNISGELESILVEPSKEINSQEYKLNKQGDIILPLGCLSPVKDVVIMEEALL